MNDTGTTRAVGVGIKSGAVGAACALLLASASTSVAATAGGTCEAGKNGVAGKYTACMHNAQSKFVKGGETETAGYDEAVLKCEHKYSGKWQKLEAKGGMACPSSSDETAIQGFLDACVASVEVALGGGTLPIDVETCNTDLDTCVGDLATCDADLAACEAEPAGQVQQTGQTLCYDAAGTVIACAGTGQDGESLAGIAQSFADNGDGTITDNRTGLMWEKLDDTTNGIHDRDNTYTWTTAVTTKIATLNSMMFAGYGDWRLPNIKELESLRNFGAVDPSTFSAFHTACAPGCNVTTCSCTLTHDYWSSSTYQLSPEYAWGVYFADGYTYALPKTSIMPVRAVRSGS